MSVQIDTTFDDLYCEWIMKFIFDVGNGMESTFVILKPHLQSIEKWRDLADAKTGLSFCSGNGKGSIKIKDGKYVFTAASSSGCDDVRLKFRVPIECISTKLHKCLDYAVENKVGFGFDKDEYIIEIL